MSALKQQKDLVLILGLSLVLPLVIYVELEPVVRVTMGFGCSLFLPGYALVAALFPGKRDLTGAERFILSIGLSILLIPLVGLMLDLIFRHVSLEAVLFAMLAFILLNCGLALHRRSTLRLAERFVLRFALPRSIRPKIGLADALASVALVLAIAAVGALLVYALVRPNVGERFTEFYVLGAVGSAGEYPSATPVGDPITLILGVVNHEQAIAQYRIERVDPSSTGQVAIINLDHDQTWEHPYTFTLTQPDADQMVEFLLYKDADPEPYRSLHLWINVTAP